MSNRSLVLLFLVFLSVNHLSTAQSLAARQLQVIATTGDLVPSLTNGETFGGGGNFDNPVLDDSGLVFFRSRMVGTGLGNTNDRAIFSANSAGDLQLILRSGDPEPSGVIPGALLQTATGSGLPGSLRIAANGTMMFSANFFGGGVTTSNDSAYYIGTPGNFQILVREGDPAPGTTGAVFSSSFGSLSQQNSSLNNSGQVLFLSDLAGGDVVGTTNNRGLFGGTLGNLSLIARKGDFWLNGEQVANIVPAFVTQMNSSGQMIFDVSFVLGTGVPAVTANDDRALWMYDPVFGITELIREGNPSPIPGVTYNHPTGGSWTINTSVTTFNNNADAILRVDLAGAVTPGVDSSAIVQVSNFGHLIIARSGDPSPIPGANFNTFSDQSQKHAHDGTITFQASLVGPGITTANDSAIFTGTPGNFVLVAREGDVAPFSGGSVFGSILGTAIQMNNSGQILFTSTLQGGAFPGSAYYTYDPELGLQPLHLFNEVVQVAPGVNKMVTGSGGIQFGNGENRPLSFSDDGTTTLRMSFSDGSASVVKMRIGSLTGVPAMISEAAGGIHLLHLNAGVSRANQVYVVIGSVTGTTPGFNFGAFNIPLNFDGYTNFMLASANTGPFLNTFAVLDGLGMSTAAVVIPPAVGGISGLTVNHAFVTLDSSNLLSFVSEASTLLIVP